MSSSPSSLPSSPSRSCHAAQPGAPRRGGSASVRLALWRTFEHSALTQVDFAEGALGISVDTFSRWIDGRTEVRTSVVLSSRFGARFRDELINALVSERERDAA